MREETLCSQALPEHRKARSPIPSPPIMGGELTSSWEPPLPPAAESRFLSATDLKPRGVVVNMIPGLPAHILFMCVRYADSLNDADMLKSLMNSAINGIKHVVKVGAAFGAGSQHSV